MKKTIYYLIIYFMLCSVLFAQPVVNKAVGFGATRPLREIPGRPPRGENDEWKVIPNKFKFKKQKENLLNSTLLQKDPVVQSEMGIKEVQSTVVSNWDGVGNINGVLPPDTQGDVGPNHYIQVVNLSFQIFDKQGNSLYGPFDLSTIWDGFVGDWTGTNDGDPVVLYDQAADRWLISQFSLPHAGPIKIDPPYFELVAISKTSDPLGEWYQYAFQFNDYMPDYPKLAVWPDGYYMATNGFNKGIAFASAGATCFERSKMLIGDPNARMIYFAVASQTSGSEAGSMLPSDWDGLQAPPAGAPNYFTYFQDDSESGVPADRLRLWEFHANWTTPASSTFTLVNTLNTASFDSNLGGSGRSVIPQPGTSQGLDDLADRLMYRLQYRNFGDHEAMVTNHTVDANGSDLAGIRWYELRNTGSGWNIYQQGTYSPDNNHRWLGSIAMNGNGDIGLEYTVSSSSIYPSIRYTGRFQDDPLGTMTIPEGTLIAGGGSQTHSAARWGDYSMMSVDPLDDQAFWITNEYIQSTGSAPWKTRIGSVSFGIPVSISVIFEGAYNSTNENMNTSINSNIPVNSPYSEAPASIGSIPSNIVDWVLVELRTDENESSTIRKKSGLLKSDGTIVGLDGISPLVFNINTGNYYIVVKHRNHLGVMSSQKVNIQ